MKTRVVAILIAIFLLVGFSAQASTMKHAQKANKAKAPVFYEYPANGTENILSLAIYLGVPGDQLKKQNPGVADWDHIPAGTVILYTKEDPAKAAAIAARSAVKSAIRPLARGIDNHSLSLQTQAQTMGKQAEAMQAQAQAMQAQTRAMQNQASTMESQAKAMGKLNDDFSHSRSAARNGFLTNLIIGILTLLAIAGVGAMIYYGIRRDNGALVTEGTLLANNSFITNAVNEARDSILEAVKNVQNTVDDSADETIRQMSQTTTFIRDPFEFDLPTGQRAIYRSPEDGLDNGFYTTLMVASYPDGLDHPETFVRQRETHRGVALRYIRGTLIKFLDGRLSGKPEERLIRYLQRTGEIEIR